MRISSFVLAGVVAVLASCAYSTGSYVPPAAESAQVADYKRVIELPYEQVWDRFIQHAAGTFFGIENFEKESGLLTLAFGADAPSEFVDGGHFTMKSVDQNGRTTTFDGPYVEFLRLYRGGTLSGRMNVVVRAIEPTKSEVTINTRYVFVARSVHPTNGSVSTQTWSFNSGSEATIATPIPIKGTSPTRTMRPTHKAERSILEALSNMK
jgi:hypothetical protein